MSFSKFLILAWPHFWKFQNLDSCWLKVLIFWFCNWANLDINGLKIMEVFIPREEQDDFLEVGTRIKISEFSKMGSSKNQEFWKAQEFQQSRIKILFQIFLISSKNQESQNSNSWYQAGVKTWNSGRGKRFKQELKGSLFIEL